MKPDQLKQFNHKLMKQLHPDKNHHPMAKDAFHKVQEAIKAVKKMNNTQSSAGASPTDGSRQQYYYPANASFNWTSNLSRLKEWAHTNL